MPTVADSVFAIVPAAGVGLRLGEAIPKQYLPIGSRSVLQWTVDALLRAPWISRVLVVVAPDDTTAAALLEGESRVQVLAVGGASRRDSVLNGLQRLITEPPAGWPALRDNDWVLVHDAARPGLRLAALARLHEALGSHPVGALLAMPCADTVKRERREPHEDSADLAMVDHTVERQGLWLAQTPQVFRCALLCDALTRAPAATDEASAVELLGLSPLLVPGDRENFKVTTRDDLALMRRLLVQTQ